MSAIAYQDFINIYIKYKFIDLFEWEFFYYGENSVELPKSHRKIFVRIALT